MMMVNDYQERNSKIVLTVRRILAYTLLIILSFLCLFPFYSMIVNSTRTHSEVVRGFTLLPGTYVDTFYDTTEGRYLEDFEVSGLCPRDGCGAVITNDAVQCENGHAYRRNTLINPVNAETGNPVELRNRVGLSAMLDNYRRAFTDTSIYIINGLLNSVFVAVLASLLTVYFSMFTAYGFHVFNFKFRKALMTFILVLMMVPTQVTTPGFLNLIGRNGILKPIGQLIGNPELSMMNTFWPLIVPAIAAPVTFFFMKQYMESSLPLDIIEAARIDGSNELRTFNTIVMPIMKPAIAVQIIFSFVSNWNNYMIPALILEDPKIKTLPVLIGMLRSADFLSFDLGRQYAFITLSILPVVIMYLILSKYIIGGVTLGAVKG